MTNYPPGVSGNEYQISGADSERDEQKECLTPDVTLTIVNASGLADLGLALDALTKPAPNVARAVGLLHAALNYDTHEVVLAECPWEGQVTVVRVGWSEFWTCPLCDAEHERDCGDDFEDDR